MTERGAPSGESSPPFVEDQMVWSRELEQQMKVGYQGIDGGWFCWFLPSGTGGCWRYESDLTPFSGRRSNDGE